MAGITGVITSLRKQSRYVDSYGKNVWKWLVNQLVYVFSLWQKSVRKADDWRLHIHVQQPGKSCIRRYFYQTVSPIPKAYEITVLTPYWSTPLAQWRQHHGAQGGTCSHFYKWLGTGGTVSRRTANKKLTKLYWPSWKWAHQKRLIVLLEPKTWRGTTKKNFQGFVSDQCPRRHCPRLWVLCIFSIEG